jgi:ABC-2 type transport system ATP-binding protein
MPDAIVVSDLRKEYGTLHAVDGVSFRVAEGQVFAFLGPNGAGKTTTVEILEGLRNRTGGSAQVLGLDPWTDGQRLHRMVGVIPQDFRFFEKITPREAIRYYRTLFGSSVDPDELLTRVGLTDKAQSRFETLSGGQKQKLGLALSLSNDPKLLFLDEPTTGLDPHARRGIWDVIRHLKAERRTVFLTTHYLEEAELLADQVGIIHHGKIIALGTPRSIIEEFGRTERLRIVGPPSIAELVNRQLGLAAEPIDGSVLVTLRDRKDALKVLSAVDAGGLAWQRFMMVEDTLEDVFIRLVGRMDEGELKSEAAS